MYHLVNATGRIGAACGAAYAKQPWKCLFGQFRLPYLQTPFLMSGARTPPPSPGGRTLRRRSAPTADSSPPGPPARAASQFDQYQLPYDMNAWPPFSAGQVVYADAFQQLVRSVVTALPAPTQPGTAVFSSACFRQRAPAARGARACLRGLQHSRGQPAARAAARR